MEMVFFAIYLPLTGSTFFLFLSFTIQFYQSSSGCVFFLPYRDLSLHRVSGVSPPFFSLTMKYSDTNLGVPSTLEHSCVAVPLSRYGTPRLPTLPLSSTNSDAVSIPSRCLLSVFSSSPSFYSPRFRHSLYKRMAASKIRAKQSQHSHEHLLSSLALVLHFTFDFSVSVGGMPVWAASVWRATRLSKCPCWIKNTAYATDVALTKIRPTILTPGSTTHIYVNRKVRGGFRYKQKVRSASALNSNEDSNSLMPLWKFNHRAAHELAIKCRIFRWSRIRLHITVILVWLMCSESVNVWLVLLVLFSLLWMKYGHLEPSGKRVAWIIWHFSPRTLIKSRSNSSLKSCLSHSFMCNEDYCYNMTERIIIVLRNVGDDHRHCKSDASLLTVATAGTADCKKMDCQMQNTHSEEHPVTRQNMCGVDYFCQVHTETQQGKAFALTILCPLHPLMNTGTHVSLTSAAPLSSDSQAKPAIGLKSAKHNPAVLLIFWTTCGRETKEGRDKRSRKKSGVLVRLHLLLCEEAALFSTVGQPRAVCFLV